MRKSRFVKAELIVLVGVAALWAVNLKTRCVPRATAGALRQVTRIVPNSQCAYELLGSTYLYLGRVDEGDKAHGRAKAIACERAVRLSPTDPNAHYALGDAYYYQERYEDAVTAYRRSIELDPQEADAHFYLGDAYCELGDLESAIQTYEKVISLDPEYRATYERLAGCYWELDRPEKSIETWKRAVSCNPEWRWPHGALAFDYNDVGRYDEAIAEWKQLIETALDPDVAGLTALLADVYLNAGQYEEAAAACIHALELQSDNKKAHHNLGRAYFKMGNTDSAWKEYETLKELDAELADDLLRLLGGRKDVPQEAPQIPAVDSAP